MIEAMKINGEATIEARSDGDDDGPYAGQYNSYTIRIKTKQETIRIAGCHDMGPDIETINRCDGEG